MRDRLRLANTTPQDGGFGPAPRAAARRMRIDQAVGPVFGLVLLAWVIYAYWFVVVPGALLFVAAFYAFARK